MSEHLCHAMECTAPCPPEHLMCLRHWRMVPRRVQMAVWDFYRPGQCDDKRPSRQWFVAAQAAILHVAVQEGVVGGDEAIEQLRATTQRYLGTEAIP